MERFIMNNLTDRIYDEYNKKNSKTYFQNETETMLSFYKFVSTLNSQQLDKFEEYKIINKKYEIEKNKDMISFVIDFIKNNKI
jgi:hypothetical protein